MIYVMYDIDHVLVIGIMPCMSMSMTTGRSHRSCLNLLYDLRVIEQTPCNYCTLLLTGSHSSISNSWRDNCWKYALEAIIKLLFISLFHDKCLLFMLELY